MNIAALTGRAPVIPVLTIDRLERAVPLARALVAGGLTVLEITLRTATALAAIEAIAEAVPEAIVGAGTVTDADGLSAALAAGAGFIVSPGFSPALADQARDAAIPFLPGVATAGEVMAAATAGLTHLKFFPAEAMGGIATLKAFAGPFADIRFCPTGGIRAENAAAYLALENVVCVGGSWVAPASAVRTGDWPAIEPLALAAADLA